MSRSKRTVDELLELLQNYARGSEEQKTAMIQISKLGKIDKEELGFKLVEGIVEDLKYFLHNDKDDKLKLFMKDIERMEEIDTYTLMEVMDTLDVKMDNIRKGKPCSEYMKTLEFYVTQGHVGGTLVFAVDSWDSLKKQRKPDLHEKACDALKKLLASNREKIYRWTQALKGGFVMKKLGDKRKSFTHIDQIVDSIWEQIEDFEDLWK
jgi:hypothetical protein